MLCQSIHHVAEARGELDAGNPNDQRYDERGYDVARPRRQGCACRLAARPAALPGNECDRNPMVGDGGMQHAHDGYGENEENGRSRCGTGQHSGLTDIWTGLCTRAAHPPHACRPAQRIADAVFHVVLDQRPFGFVNNAFHGLKLLGQFEAGPYPLGGRQSTTVQIQSFRNVRAVQ